MKIAIVSDPLVQRGGAERLVEALADVFPSAPIFAVLYSEESGPALLAPRIRVSWLNSIPFATKRHRLFFPFYRSAIESFDLSEFDVILSSHHTVAKGCLTRADQLHICYCHTPMRAIWERPAEELATLNQFIRPLATALVSNMRVWDAVTSMRVQKFIANSSTTRKRISTYYRRDSSIIFPPIDVNRFILNESARDEYYLVASRAVPYKRVDIAIEATGMIGRRLKIVGGSHSSGNHPPHVEFLGHVSDNELVHQMQNAKALLHPQIEDFGMAALEANACGTPVVATGAGGALDSVIDGSTGILATEQSVDAFASAIRRLEQGTFIPSELRGHAMQFSRDRFIANINKYVEDAWEEFSTGRSTMED